MRTKENIYVGSMKANLTSFKSNGDLQGRQLGSGVFKVKRLSQWVEVDTKGVAGLGLMACKDLEMDYGHAHIAVPELRLKNLKVGTKFYYGCKKFVGKG